MPKKSAGLLIYRINNQEAEVLLVHPGGPLWVKKDLEAWTIPKGEIAEDEEPLAAAIREVEEETGLVVAGECVPLSPVKQKSGKWVYAWAYQGDIDPSAVKSNFFEMNWPPRSGRKQTFPEIDRAEWFTMNAAKQKINPAQVAFLDELNNILDNQGKL